MKGLPLTVLAALSLLFSAACTSARPLAVVDHGPSSASSGPRSATSGPSSATSGPSSASASECNKTSRKGNSVVMVDWVDFVQLNGTQFIADNSSVPPIASAHLGTVVGRVQCQLSALEFSKQPGPIVDGDAAFLTIGTEVHSILGFEPSCRVAARVESTNRVYLAHHDVGGYSKAVPCAKAP